MSTKSTYHCDFCENPITKKSLGQSMKMAYNGRSVLIRVRPYNDDHDICTHCQMEAIIQMSKELLEEHCKSPNEETPERGAHKWEDVDKPFDTCGLPREKVELLVQELGKTWPDLFGTPLQRIAPKVSDTKKTVQAFDAVSELLAPHRASK